MRRFVRVAASFKKHLRRKKPRARSKRNSSVLALCLLILLWSVVLGWGLAQASGNNQRLVSQATTPATSQEQIGTVDVIPQGYQLGQKIYLESCGSCHIALPPAAFPTETWQQLLQDPQHYGKQITSLVDPPRSLVWSYLQTFSRRRAAEEQVPYRIGESRYFRALHPRVKLPQSISSTTCITCHPGAAQYNFRQLTPEWEKAP